ncbi:WD40-repeat-containing domain protein [Daedaleopsis nitida]|nr:WD40-repeat-containing domain protein [Daedaleopsis nitida]
MAQHIVLLDRLDHYLKAYQAEKSTDADRKTRDKKYVKILEDVCTVVRDAERRGSPDLTEIIEKAHTVLNASLQYAYSQGGGFSSLVSFAHSEDEPFVEDALENAGSDVLDAFVKFYTSMLKPGAPVPKLPAFARVRPWTKTLRPHPLTTRLSRFRGGFAPSATVASPSAHIVYQARAQLTIDSLASAPFDIILAMSVGGGLKGRNPLLHYYILGDQPSNLLEGTSIDPGLLKVAHYVVTDESRKLVFLADDDCIKSFSFAPDDTGKVPKRLKSVHTLACQPGFEGSLAVLPNGRIARAGKGKAAIWSLDSPASHTTASFEDDLNYFPAAWHFHDPSGHMICAEGAEESGGYACMSIDFEHGGKRVARYLGHGGEVERITTSPADPNVFITAGSDGYARLYDVRRPLPVLTFNTGLQREVCSDVVLVHPDGIPTLFTGGDITQQVKMWDIRAEECVYELSTGNNSVVGLAWDPARSSLFVATECRYVNRLGVRTGYRRARVPQWATWKAVDQEYKAHRDAVKNGTYEDDADSVYGGKDYPDVYDDYLDDGDAEESGEEEDIDENYSADMRWPQKCFHKEDFFGYAYDAGEHVLFRWHFKDTPDIAQLPASTTLDLD